MLARAPSCPVGVCCSFPPQVPLLVVPLFPVFCWFPLVVCGWPIVAWLLQVDLVLDSSSCWVLGTFRTFHIHYILHRCCNGGIRRLFCMCDTYRSLCMLPRLLYIVRSLRSCLICSNLCTCCTSLALCSGSPCCCRKRMSCLMFSRCRELS